MWGGKPDLMEVTEIAFDPYQKGRILVGTRDAGIICSANGGKTWRTIFDLPKINYITGFHFRPEGAVYISSYGHGLWYLKATTGCPEAEDLPWDRKPPIIGPTETPTCSCAKRLSLLLPPRHRARLPNSSFRHRLRLPALQCLAKTIVSQCPAAAFRKAKKSF